MANFEFHIARATRDKYQFDLSLFSLSGNVIFTDFQAARLFAQKMNQKRDLVRYPEQAVLGGQVNAMGLIDEILHFVAGKYRQLQAPFALQDALDWIYREIGKEEVEKTLRNFALEFPPLSVYRGETNLEEYLSGTTQLSGGITIPNTCLLLEELLLLWLANVNPAFSSYLELFEDTHLKHSTSYLQIIDSLHDFFDTQPVFGPDNQKLIDMLRSPAIAVPHSLTGQLEFMRSRWGYLLGEYLSRLLSSLDFLNEETKAIFLGPGPAHVYDFTGLELEIERFSPDKDWMPNLVLIAKNAYVWLDQLSKKYSRSISHLDEIPDAELDSLALWGFSGLWLIGLWERSQASQRIKQMRGNPEAVASAYSLFDYTIAADLGGEAAYLNLRQRAWQRGIRLASDMVPNHMGIDSRWLIEHPDWFISLDYSPFPSYSFNGQNLSWDERTGIFIEDHYYNNTDAAVVFKRVDFQTGQQKYIYHGNDGTSMPWNDTAQLNFLKPEVREAVIQTILHVARLFPIIRFDAAMTLAKRHYQRLWYPEPGSGGDIPSRAGQGLTRQQFNAAFPTEFWREVVDRLAREAPDTLLLAEAFWLMEGFFVRTLGMHRVYNSAFMNMLRDEKNQEYRLVIKNTLEFDPEILKRYVNFMNNPDERTAVDQFGKGDKYFGICTMMATLPGLPMFGHGQIEGFTEKYGMEYRRAYWDEQADTALVERHEREIFPLLRRRNLFADAGNFLLYDFYTPEGNVNEDVYAYTNRVDNNRALVVYHNRYSSTQGWIRLSAATTASTGDGNKILIRKSLGEGLELHKEDNYFTIFYDQVNGLEYIRSSKEMHEKGLFIALDAYKYHVFLDFREVQDDEKCTYARLSGELNGKGVTNISQALKQMVYAPICRSFRELSNAGQLQWLIDNRLIGGTFKRTSILMESVLVEVENKVRYLLREIAIYSRERDDIDQIARGIIQDVQAALRLPALDRIFSLPKSKTTAALMAYLDHQQKLSAGDPLQWGILLGWILTRKLGEVHPKSELSASYTGKTSRAWLEEWTLDRILCEALVELGVTEDHAWRAINQIKLASQQDWGTLIGSNQLKSEGAKKRAYQAVQSWLAEAEIQAYLGVHRFQDVTWFNKEAFEEWLWGMFVMGITDLTGAKKSAWSDKKINEAIFSFFRVIRQLQLAQEKSGYQVEKLLEALK